MSKELVAEWLETLFPGQESGYIYTPYKTATGQWIEKFFEWPSNKKAAVTFINAKSHENDVYVSPSLFKARNATRENWKGTNYVWAEFDGNAPDNLRDGIPEPSIRVQSSTRGHEHWYWRLETFTSDENFIEGLNRQLAYTLDSDKSGWERNQVLRPLGTIHHDSTNIVSRLHHTENKFNAGAFSKLATAPSIISIKAARLPDVRNVVGRYKWDAEALELFERPQQEQGSRSSALTALGFACIEMGMTNDECLTILYDADDRWKKFTSRTEESRYKALLGVINYCRSKKEINKELQIEERNTFISLRDFNELDLRVDWLYDNLLPERGLGIISSLPGHGKTTLSMHMGWKTILGHDFLVWKNPGRGRRVGLVSLEMGSHELKVFIEEMMRGFAPHKEAILDDFFMLPLGYSLVMGDKDVQKFMVEEIKKHKIEFLIIDSLKAATRLDESILNKFFDWINKVLRQELGVTVWIIHHNRKPSGDNSNKAPQGVEDLYGDVFISAHATTVIALHKQQRGMQVIPLKVRLAEEVKAFRVKRGPHLGFEVDTSTPDEPTTKSVLGDKFS